VIALASTLLTTVYNVFITGIFFTGFLSMYGMSIADTGVLTFVPYIANLFSVFSPSVLSRFRRRKGVLLWAKLVYYLLYIVVSTLIPSLVADPRLRLWLFVGVSFVSTAFFSLFNPGLTLWFYKFYPEAPDKRIHYLQLTQIFSSILSSSILLLSGRLTDAVAGSANAESLILGFRYFAFILVLGDVLIQSGAKEYPVRDTSHRLRDIATLPFSQKKFLGCCGLMFIWNFISNLNNGLWNYHLLNHIHFGYGIINAVSACYTVILLLFSPLWKRVLRQHSWIKTWAISMLLFLPSEFIFFFMDSSSTYLFLPTSLWQQITSVGINLAYANILYMNLPEDNSTAHIAFNTLGCNIFAFLGLMCGTWVSSLSGDTTMEFFGLQVYSVQFTTLMRGVSMLIMGIFLLLRWRDFTGSREAASIDSLARHRKNAKQKGRLYASSE